MIQFCVSILHSGAFKSFLDLVEKVMQQQIAKLSAAPLPAFAPHTAVLSPGPRGAPGHLARQLAGNPRHHTGHLAASLASAANSQPTCM